MRRLLFASDAGRELRFSHRAELSFSSHHVNLSSDRVAVYTASEYYRMIRVASNLDMVHVNGPIEGTGLIRSFEFASQHVALLLDGEVIGVDHASFTQRRDDPFPRNVVGSLICHFLLC